MRMFYRLPLLFISQFRTKLVDDARDSLEGFVVILRFRVLSPLLLV